MTLPLMRTRSIVHPHSQLNIPFSPFHFSPPVLTFSLTCLPPLKTNLIRVHISILLQRWNGIHRQSFLRRHNLWRRKILPLTMAMLSQAFPKFLAFTVSQRWQKVCTKCTTYPANGLSAQLSLMFPVRGLLFPKNDTRRSLRNQTNTSGYNSARRTVSNLTAKLTVLHRLYV
jgi:hypothetical protein